MIMEDKDENLVKPFHSSNKFIMIAGVILVILVGLGVGFFVSGKKATGTMGPKITSGPAIIVAANEAGVKDPSTIKDVTTATGILKEGGIKGEGKYHLEREGGITQTVYLNSTTVDISPFVDKKVQVWGQTQASQHANWFMDVVKIKVVE